MLPGPGLSPAPGLAAAPHYPVPAGLDPAGSPLCLPPQPSWLRPPGRASPLYVGLAVLEDEEVAIKLGRTQVWLDVR